MSRPRQGDEPYTMLSIRFPHWMVEAIDRHLHAMHGTTPMVTLSRSDAVRDLVFRSLKELPGETPTQAAPRPRRTGRKAVGDAA